MGHTRGFHRVSFFLFYRVSIVSFQFWSTLVGRLGLGVADAMATFLEWVSFIFILTQFPQNARLRLSQVVLTSFPPFILNWCVSTHSSLCNARVVVVFAAFWHVRASKGRRSMNKSFNPSNLVSTWSNHFISCLLWSPIGAVGASALSLDVLSSDKDSGAPYTELIISAEHG